MKKQIVLSILVSILTLTAYAQPPKQGQHGKEGEGKEMRGGHHKMMMEQLNLSEEQQTQVETIHKRTKKAGLVIKNQLGEKEARMTTLTSADKADIKAITQLSKEIGALKNEKYLMKTLAKVAVRALLDEDQKLTFDTMRGKHRRHGEKKCHN